MYGWVIAVVVGLYVLYSGNIWTPPSFEDRYIKYYEKNMVPVIGVKFTTKCQYDPITQQIKHCSIDDISYSRFD